MTKEEIQKHLDQLNNERKNLNYRIGDLQLEESSISNRIEELKRKLKQLTRNTIEYHEGDLLIRFNRNFSYHDTICGAYQLLNEIKPSEDDTSMHCLELELRSYDWDIWTKAETSWHLDLLDFEEDENVYYVKSHAFPDLTLLFCELSKEKVPDKVEKLFERIQEVIDKHEGKRLVNVIAETKKYREE